MSVINLRVPGDTPSVEYDPVDTCVELMLTKLRACAAQCGYVIHDDCADDLRKLWDDEITLSIARALVVLGEPVPAPDEAPTIRLF